MAPFFLDKLSPKPPIDGDQDQNSSLSPLTTLSADDHASSLSFPFLFTTPQYQGFTQMDHHFQPPPPPPPLHQEPLNLLLIGGSSDQQQRPPLIPTPNNENIVDHHGDDLPGSSKWMYNSKIRIMRKTMISSGDDRMRMTKPQRNFQVLQDQYPNLGATSASGGITGSSPNGFVRVCSECNTTKTPLWRGGPRGPKSLCNACGIRQMKARRAMATSTAANANDGVAPKVKKDKRSYNMDRSTLPFKKRCKITISETTKKKLRFDNVAVSLSKDSDFHRVFPQDEREAAILLMGLSCGLIQG